ncbi:hypothetical protein PV325_011471 [Microctonus aethiopoides]|nr:hypothetical protein PV325_011471 [Microctonus aethiopoides]
MNEYVSKNNKRKLVNLDDDNDDNNENEKMKNNEIVKQSRTNSTLKKSTITNVQDTEQSTTFDDVYLKSTTNECSVKKQEVSETKSRLNSKPISSSNATNSAQQQQQNQHQPQSTNANTKTTDGIPITARTMSEEELRNERKRKQREKQEEYRRLMMKDKELKVEEKSNSKF